MTILDFEPGTVRSTELYGDYWFNSEPVPMAAQRGYVILLDFWDYSSAASVHAVRYINDWFLKYSPSGLVMVGVHTPRFSFGKDPENVRKAIQRLGIKYPVVMDNDAMIWSRYGNRLWPAQHVIDRNGFVRLINAGGGNFSAVEHEIQTLMLDAGLIDDLPELTGPVHDVDRPGVVCFRATPEIFAGYLRGSMGNIEGYGPESEIHYADPGIYLEGKFYVAGDWSNDRDDLRLVGDNEGNVVFRYTALEADAVLSVSGKNAVRIAVQQDGIFLTAENKGEDVLLEANGRSVLLVHDPRSYNIVRNKEHGEHLLKLTAGNDGVSLFSLSFVPGPIPELIPR